MKLTESSLRVITKSPKYQTGKLVSDDDQPGLYLRIGKSGKASWCLLDQRAGKFSTRTFGQWPKMAVADARIQAAQLRREDRGEDIPTWKGAAERYLKYVDAKRNRKTGEKLVEHTKRNIERILLERYATLLSTKLDMVSRQKVAEIALVQFEERPEMGLKCLKEAKAFTAWCAKTDLIQRDPLALLDKEIFGGYTSKARDRVLTDDELRTVLADESRTGIAMRWQLHTCCRIGEALQADPLQIVDDVWTIPKVNTKSRRAARVPLSTGAKKLLDYLPLGLADSSAQTHMAKYYRDVDVHTHDMRRTAATRARELGIPYDVVEFDLLHHAQPKLMATYQHHDRIPAAREALEKLSAHYEAVVAKAPK